MKIFPTVPITAITVRKIAEPMTTANECLVTKSEKADHQTYRCMTLITKIIELASGLAFILYTSGLKREL